MPRKLNYPSRWAVFLLLTFFSLQVGARLNVCLMPDGDVHVKKQHSAYDTAKSQDAIAAPHASDHQLDSQAHLHIAIGETAATYHQKNTPPPPSAIIPLGGTITFSQTARPLPANKQSDLSAQLLPIRSVAILRI